MTNLDSKHALPIVGLLSAVIAAVLPLIVVPQYRAFFDLTGIHLPLLTTFFVNYGAALWLLPLSVLWAWFYWPRSTRRGLAACVIGVVSLLLVVPLLWLGMYLPILRWGV
jgi:hypothetical protein